MGRRRKSGDTAKSSYQRDPTDITHRKFSFFRIRRWYAMQTSRLRRSDAVHSRPLPSSSWFHSFFTFRLIKLVFFLECSQWARKALMFCVVLIQCQVLFCVYPKVLPLFYLWGFFSLTLVFLTGPIFFYFVFPPFILENHDGAPAATATSPLSKRKVFGGWVVNF